MTAASASASNPKSGFLRLHGWSESKRTNWLLFSVTVGLSIEYFISIRGSSARKSVLDPSLRDASMKAEVCPFASACPTIEFDPMTMNH